MANGMKKDGRWIDLPPDDWTTRERQLPLVERLAKMGRNIRWDKKIKHNNCHICRLEIMAYNSVNTSDKYIYEISMFEKDNASQQNLKSFRQIHHWCAERCLGDIINKTSRIHDIYCCHSCRMEIVRPKYPFPIYVIAEALIVDRVEHIINLQGSIEFCDDCWINMAGESFFN